MITASTTLATDAARIAGYRQALAVARITPLDEWVSVVEYTQEAAQSAAMAMLAIPQSMRPTGIFATDSFMSAWAFRGIQAAGLSVPQDVSLIGFDDVDWMSMVRPQISVVDQPVYELGKRAAERLIARIEGDTSPPQHVWLQTTLLLRGSCAPPRSWATAVVVAGS
jgi:LacI family transcriptional regulator